MTISEFFAANPVCAVAFSGGIDSAWLLHEALRYGTRMQAYFVRTPFQPAFELQDARDTAAALGAALTVLEVDVLTLPQVAENPEDRCYFCKQALFTALLAQARADGFPLVLDGSNASDDAGDRPGMRALRSWGSALLCGSAASPSRRSVPRPGRQGSSCGTSPPTPVSPHESPPVLPSPVRISGG